MLRLVAGDGLASGLGYYYYYFCLLESLVFFIDISLLIFGWADNLGLSLSFSGPLSDLLLESEADSFSEDESCGRAA